MANQTECSWLEQRSVMKFLVVKKRKPCEIYRRICDVYGEGIVYNWTKNGSVLKRQSMKWKHTYSLVKKKFWAQWPVKKVMLTVLISLKNVQLYAVQLIANSLGHIHLIFWMTFVKDIVNIIINEFIENNHFCSAFRVILNNFYLNVYCSFYGCYSKPHLIRNHKGVWLSFFSSYWLSKRLALHNHTTSLPLSFIPTHTHTHTWNYFHP